MTAILRAHIWSTSHTSGRCNVKIIGRQTDLLCPFKLILESPSGDLISSRTRWADFTHPGCCRRQCASDRVSYRVIRRKRGRAVGASSPPSSFLSPPPAPSSRATPLSRYRAIGSYQLSLTGWRTPDCCGSTAPPSGRKRFIIIGFFLSFTFKGRIWCMVRNKFTSLHINWIFQTLQYVLFATQKMSKTFLLIQNIQ